MEKPSKFLKTLSIIYFILGVIAAALCTFVCISVLMSLPVPEPLSNILDLTRNYISDPTLLIFAFSYYAISMLTILIGIIGIFGKFKLRTLAANMYLYINIFPVALAALSYGFQPLMLIGLILPVLFLLAVYITGRKEPKKARKKAAKTESQEKSDSFPNTDILPPVEDIIKLKEDAPLLGLEFEKSKTDEFKTESAQSKNSPNLFLANNDSSRQNLNADIQTDTAAKHINLEKESDTQFEPELGINSNLQAANDQDALGELPGDLKQPSENFTISGERDDSAIPQPLNELKFEDIQSEPFAFAQNQTFTNGINTEPDLQKETVIPDPAGSLYDTQTADSQEQSGSLPVQQAEEPGNADIGILQNDISPIQFSDEIKPENIEPLSVTQDNNFEIRDENPDIKSDNNQTADVVNSFSNVITIEDKIIKENEKTVANDFSESIQNSTVSEFPVQQSRDPEIVENESLTSTQNIEFDLDALIEEFEQELSGVPKLTRSSAREPEKSNLADPSETAEKATESTPSESYDIVENENEMNQPEPQLSPQSSFAYQTESVLTTFLNSKTTNALFEPESKVQDETNNSPASSLYEFDKKFVPLSTDIADIPSEKNDPDEFINEVYSENAKGELSFEEFEKMFYNKPDESDF